MLKKEEILLIIYFVAVIFFLILVVVIFFIAFQKRKNRFLLERLEARQKFEKELANAQIEIQEQTLKNIAWELHDNVGQLLSVANMQLNQVLANAPEELSESLNETKSLVADTVREVRSLSKTLNNDVVLKNGLIPSIKVEIERFNRLNFLTATFKVDGTEEEIPSSDEIIIFRILQEFLSNVIKHAKASKLFVHLKYEEKGLDISAQDNGLGFDAATTKENSGMRTMESRARLLNASYSISSQPGEGTQLNLNYPYKRNG